MSSQSNTLSESPLEAQAMAPATISASRRFYCAVRRELWESRSIYIAPFAVAALFLSGFMIGSIHLPEKMRAASLLAPAMQHETIEQPYNFAALVLMATSIIVAVFYCLDALHGERRDRSILFWKSLPVSDLLTVLSKASIPIVIIPLVTFAITVATQLVMLVFSSAVLLGSGMSAAIVWNHLPLFQMSVMLLYHLLALHGIWYAPFYGWLLLVSAWARRAAFLWAALPLLAIGFVEKIAFNTSHFAAMLENRLGSGPGSVASTPGSGMVAATPGSMVMLHVSLGQFLISPGLWIGLAITAAFLAVAVQMRRRQGPI